MHREIQIKQFTIVTTHWWPKTRNERFVLENEQYLYRFLPLVHNHVQVIWVRTHIRCVTCVCVWRVCVWRVCARADGGRVWSVVLTQLFKRQRRRQPISRLMHIPNPVHATPEKYVIGCCNYDGASAPRFRHALRQALTPTPVWMQREPERAHTHVTHRMCVRTQITWTWLCTRGKKQYKYCSFSHTNRSFRVLGHQCVVTMGNCLIWISCACSFSLL